MWLEATEKADAHIFKCNASQPVNSENVESNRDDNIWVNISRINIHCSTISIHTIATITAAAAAAFSFRHTHFTELCF